MINNRQNNRRRGRGGGSGSGGIRASGPSGGVDRGNRIDNRARGNANQLHEKYKTLARDAQTQGDRVMAEYYLQFADHYYRIINETRSRTEEPRRGRDDQLDRDDQEEFGDEDEFAENAGNQAPRRDEHRRDEHRVAASQEREPRQPREQRQSSYNDQNDGGRAPGRDRDDAEQGRRRFTGDRAPQSEEGAPARQVRAPRPRPVEEAAERPQADQSPDGEIVAARPRGRGRPPREERVAEPVVEERIEVDRLPPAFAATAPEAVDEDVAVKPKRRGRPPRRVEVPAVEA